MPTELTFPRLFELLGRDLVVMAMLLFPVTAAANDVERQRIELERACNTAVDPVAKAEACERSRAFNRGQTEAWREPLLRAERAEENARLRSIEALHASRAEKDALRARRLFIGATTDMVLLGWGSPVDHWRRTTKDGVTDYLKYSGRRLVVLMNGHVVAIDE